MYSATKCRVYFGLIHFDRFAVESKFFVRALTSRRLGQLWPVLFARPPFSGQSRIALCLCPKASEPCEWLKCMVRAQTKTAIFMGANMPTLFSNGNVFRMPQPSSDDLTYASAEARKAAGLGTCLAGSCRRRTRIREYVRGVQSYSAECRHQGNPGLARPSIDSSTALRLHRAGADAVQGLLAELSTPQATCDF